MRFSHALFTCVSVCSFQRSVSSPDRVVLGRDLPPRCVSNLSVSAPSPEGPVPLKKQLCEVMAAPRLADVAG